MVGWAAVTGTVTIEPIVLFLMIFMWTPPHFWALALYKSQDFARAGIPMLPVVAGPDETRRQILIYTLLYLPLTLAPVLHGFAGVIYGVGATAAGALFMLLAWRVYRIREGDAAETAAKHLFGFSILQLLLLFTFLLVEGAFGLRIALPLLGA
jgi:protoheme IX farnesyltransferase